MQNGLITWLETRSKVRADRNGLRGTELNDLEKDQGLDSFGFAPWLEFSIGGKVRVGADGSWFVRDGDYEQQDNQVIFNGVVLAERGDFVKTRFEFGNVGAWLEWDALYGRTYRIGGDHAS